jgi:hypothetical protein
MARQASVLVDCKTCTNSGRVTLTGNDLTIVAPRGWLAHVGYQRGVGLLVVFECRQCVDARQRIAAGGKVARL